MVTLTTSQQTKQSPSNIFDTADQLIKLQRNSLHDQEKKTVRRHKRKRLTFEEWLLYLSFTCIVLIMAFISREEQAFYQNRSVDQLLALHLTRDGKDRKVFSHESAWWWVEHNLLPQLHLETRERNLSNVQEAVIKSLVGNLGSVLISGVRLRQVRMLPYSCKVPTEMRSIIKRDCVADYDPGLVEKRHFVSNWSRATTSKQPQDAWKFLESSKFERYPIIAERGTYYDGGYVEDVFPNSENVVKELKGMGWIDRRSRALIIEFALLNIPTSRFNSVTIVFEFPAVGGLVSSATIFTFRLDRYVTIRSVVKMTCAVMFAVFILHYFCCEVNELCESGCLYFAGFGNLVEASILCLSFSAVGLYFYREWLFRTLAKKFLAQADKVFINFRLAAYVDAALTYVISLIVFFVLVKFLKLLSFNKRIFLLSRTLRTAWYPMLMFSTVLVIFLAGMMSLSTMAFGQDLYEYRNPYASITSIISLLLGKFSYARFESSNRILGAIFYVVFAVVINWIVVNMLVSILIDAFADVRNNSGLDGYENWTQLIQKVRSCDWLDTKEKRLAKKERRKIEKSANMCEHESGSTENQFDSGDLQLSSIHSHILQCEGNENDEVFLDSCGTSSMPDEDDLIMPSMERIEDVMERLELCVDWYCDEEENFASRSSFA